MSYFAYIISAYKDAPHLKRLIQALDEDADFYIHVDLNADIRPFENIRQENVFFVPRHRISWGGWQQVEYQKELLAAVMKSGRSYQRVVCLSGQDYPLWSNREMREFFDAHAQTEYIMGMNLSRCHNIAQRNKIVCYHFFRDLPWKNQWLKNKVIVLARHLMKILPIRKPATTLLQGKPAEVYFGSDYWALTGACAKYVYLQLCSEPEAMHYFRYSFIPSELCIQTIVFNSPFASRALLVEEPYQGLYALTPLHYIVYQQSIQLMTARDLPALLQSGKMFCRKVVSGYSDELVSQLDKKRKKTCL